MHSGPRWRRRAALLRGDAGHRDVQRPHPRHPVLGLDVGARGEQQRHDARVVLLAGLRVDEGALSFVTFISCSYGDYPYKRELGGVE